MEHERPNTDYYNLHENIAHLINNSGLPSMGVYFVLKDIMRDLKENAFKSLEIEKGVSNE